MSFVDPSDVAALAVIALTDPKLRRAAPLPELVVEAITSSAAMAREGRYEVPDDLVRQKLGRRAHRLERWIVAHRAAFAP